MTYTCLCCGYAAEFATPDDAYAAGWDVPPMFSIACCPLCPASPIALQGVEGARQRHNALHARWARDGRPSAFDLRTELALDAITGDDATDVIHTIAKMHDIMTRPLPGDVLAELRTLFPPKRRVVSYTPDGRISRCRQCGVEFPVKRGAAGQYCTVACYRSPMRTELRVREHLVNPRENVFEVWFDGEFIATVTPAKRGPGVQIISKHRVEASIAEGRSSVAVSGHVPNVIDVAIRTERT